MPLQKRKNAKTQKRKNAKNKNAQKQSVKLSAGRQIYNSDMSKAVSSIYTFQHPMQTNPPPQGMNTSCQTNPPPPGDAHAHEKEPLPSVMLPGAAASTEAAGKATCTKWDVDACPRDVCEIYYSLMNGLATPDCLRKWMHQGTRHVRPCACPPEPMSTLKDSACARWFCARGFISDVTMTTPLMVKATGFDQVMEVLAAFKDAFAPYKVHAVCLDGPTNFTYAREQCRQGRGNSLIGSSLSLH